MLAVGVVAAVAQAASVNTFTAKVSVALVHPVGVIEPVAGVYAQQALVAMYDLVVGVAVVERVVQVLSVK